MYKVITVYFTVIPLLHPICSFHCWRKTETPVIRPVLKLRRRRLYCYQVWDQKYLPVRPMFPLLYDERGGPPCCFSKQPHSKNCHLVAISRYKHVYIIALCGYLSTHWMRKNQCGCVEIWVNGWWTGKKMKEQKRSSKPIDIVSYTLEVSVNVVSCVFVVHFRSSDTFFSL